MRFSSGACNGLGQVGTSLTQRTASSSTLKRHNAPNPLGAVEIRWSTTSTNVENVGESGGALDTTDLNIQYFKDKDPADKAYAEGEGRKRALVQHLNRKKQDTPYKYTKYNSKARFRPAQIELQREQDDVQPQPQTVKASERNADALGGNLGSVSAPSKPRVKELQHPLTNDLHKAATAHDTRPLIKKHFKDGPLFRPFPTDEPLKLRKVKDKLHITHTYPKLDTFLIDDFRPVLRMLWEATPETTTKAEGGQLDIDNAYWEALDSDIDESVGGIGDLIDDVTYAPLPEARRIRTTGTIRSNRFGRPVGLVRTFWFGSRGSETGLALQPRPEQWTQDSFLVYLKRLIALGVRGGKDPDPEHMSNATQEIISLFNGERFQPYITSRALNVAIDYLCWQQQFEAALQIYTRLRDESFSFDPQDFSTLLFAAAWEETTSHFRPVLEHMLSSGFQPTGHTWFTFYQLISRKYPDKRQQVLIAMRNKGVLNDGPTVKEALVAFLGWIEKSELVPDPPVRPSTH